MLMRVKFPSLIRFFLPGMFAVAIVANAALAAPSLSFVPARTGQTVALRYQFDISAQDGPRITNGILTLTRASATRLTVTLTPDDGKPYAVDAAIAGDGSIQTDRGVTGTPSPLPSEQPPIIGPAPATNAPSDTRGGTSAGPSLPRGLREVVAVLVRAPANPTGNWTFPLERDAPTTPVAAPIPTGAPSPSTATRQPALGPLQMSVYANPGPQNEVTFIADGNGTTNLPAPGSSPSPSAHHRSGGGEGFPGGSFPGGGFPSGGFPGGRGHGSHGNSTEEGSRGNTTAQFTLHIETTLRNGVFFAARGSETAVSQRGGGNQVITTSWLLTAFATPTPAPTPKPKATPKH